MGSGGRSSRIDLRKRKALFSSLPANVDVAAR